MKIRLTYLITLSLLLTSCAIHKIDVQQGNVLTNAVVQQVKLGMSRKQVQFLLGNPAIKDPFSPDRWDYPFRFQSGKKGTALEHYHITIFFEGGSVIRIDADMPETDFLVRRETSHSASQPQRSGSAGGHRH